MEVLQAVAGDPHPQVEVAMVNVPTPIDRGPFRKLAQDPRLRQPVAVADIAHDRAHIPRDPVPDHLVVAGVVKLEEDTTTITTTEIDGEALAALAALATTATTAAVAVAVAVGTGDEQRRTADGVLL